MTFRTADLTTHKRPSHKVLYAKHLTLAPAHCSKARSSQEPGTSAHLRDASPASASPDATCIPGNAFDHPRDSTKDQITYRTLKSAIKIAEYEIEESMINSTKPLHPPQEHHTNASQRVSSASNAP